MRTLHQLICRIAGKAVLAVAFTAFVLAGAALYFFATDSRAEGSEAQLRAELDELDGKMAEAHRRIELLEIEVPAEKERVVRAEKVIEQLRQLKSTWGWLGVNRAQERANAERLQKMEAFHVEASAKLVELQQELRRLRWERDGHEIEREQVASKLSAEEARKASRMYFWQRVWQQARAWLLLGVAGYLIALVVMPVWWRRRKQRRAAAV